MTSPSLDTEYADLTPLQVRIATHQRHSEQPDDPVAAVLTALGLNGSDDLVDIGCGDARFLAHLRETGHTGRLVGVDASPTMVATAATIPGVTAIHGKASKLPLQDGEFDVCTARHMLYHVTDPLVALSEFRRITRPGGKVAVTVNHARTCHRTHQLVAAHARKYGLTAPDGMINYTVTSDTLPDMMQDVFGNTTIETHDNALVFDRPAPLIAFAEALFTFCGIAPDSPHRVQILADVTTDIEHWFIAHPNQLWRDSKGYSIATAIITG
ncbi:class I SAM-dependent methyltransferase [Nocardia carnea]|uniref:class I SAM-dependent methyltransferase n=1 Tax=Nocardia carnea TaxID=37328 RepID=UPI0024574092|nr:class I SAM-dependent methyltransferase [Nocardia carnea]